MKKEGVDQETKGNGSGSVTNCSFCPTSVQFALFFPTTHPLPQILQSSEYYFLSFSIGSIVTASYVLAIKMHVEYLTYNEIMICERVL